MNQYANPPWWGSDHDFAWDHVKLNMERELKARYPAGLEINSLERPSFREFEPACRYGYGARLEYDREYVAHDNKLTQYLRADWRFMYPKREQEWQKDCIAILWGWNYASEELKPADHNEIKNVFVMATKVMDKNLMVKNIIIIWPHWTISLKVSLVESAMGMKFLDMTWLPLWENAA